jgi:hypothetical protein
MTRKFVVGCVLKLATFWCSLPGEFRQADWVQLDLDGEKRAYIVPPRIRKLLEAAKENPNTESPRVP